MKKVRTALVAAATLLVLILGSGIAEAGLKLRPNW